MPKNFAQILGNIKKSTVKEPAAVSIQFTNDSLVKEPEPSAYRNLFKLSIPNIPVAVPTQTIFIRNDKFQPLKEGLVDGITLPKRKTNLQSIQERSKLLVAHSD